MRYDLDKVRIRQVSPTFRLYNTFYVYSENRVLKRYVNSQFLIVIYNPLRKYICNMMSHKVGVK